MPPIDPTSKTTLVLAVTFLCGVLAVVGVNISDDQKTALMQGATDVAQAVTLIGPIVAWIYHQIAKKKAQTALVNLGATHDDAKAATKS